MARELGIEKFGTDLLSALGWLQVKVGYDGWPDRLVIWAPTRHFWWEVKQPDGSLTKAQRIRIPWLRDAGEIVFIYDSRNDFADFLRMLR